MSISDIDFDEVRQSQLPFVEVLLALGYTYISRADVNLQRGGDTRKFLLHDIALTALMQINSYEHDGETHKFSEKDVLAAVDELENIPLEGLIDTSAEVYKMLMPSTGGKTIRVAHGGKNISKNFKFIDFENVDRNAFHVSVEFEASGKKDIRPDIVIFVNGIPFSIVENKRASVGVEKSLQQMHRNQSAQRCPKLFVYPQLLIGTNGKDFRYGTTGTPPAFYAQWREKDHEKDVEKKSAALSGQNIDSSLYATILGDLDVSPDYEQKTDRKPTEQDRSICALFEKERLLDLTKNFILYDAGIKKIMRYQQYFAIKKTQDRIAREKESVTGMRREGGLLWHTQGSGKSLTMVMFVRALIEDSTIINPRILIVTDRKDLDRQIRNTFRNAGLKKDVIQARTGSHLLELIQKKELAVVTTLIHKFQSASKKKTGFVDDDKNIFVLIDEAHRSQGGDANLEMNRIIPNACYIAFTGTPLLKREKSQNKFGSFIDKYTIDDALSDEIILPLIYEGRFVDLTQDRDEIDRMTERLTSDLSDEQKKKLQKMVEKKIIADNPRRIVEIAHDIERHFIDRLQGTGLKAQIVAPSKYSATIFQKYFEEQAKIKTALVISDENGIIDEKDEHKTEVDDYLKKVKDAYQSLKKYEESVVDSFTHNEDGIEIIIVVDKLLTGFDAPRNTVLYLAKELRDHNLLQAIARVNRLHDNPLLPKTSGYIVDYSENATHIKSAMELFGSYDSEDVESALTDVTQKVASLDAQYGKLHDLFNGVAADDESYLAHLSDEQKRKEFYTELRSFLTEFSECMSLQGFAHATEKTDMYRKELKKYMELRKIVSLKYAESVDFGKYKIALTQIMDDNIKAHEAELLTHEINITDREVFEEAIENLGSDKSKAEAIAHQTKRTITENIKKDPIFYTHFSQKISELIDKMREQKISDIEALKEARKINDEVLGKKDENIPPDIYSKEGADILFRSLSDVVGLDNITTKQLCTTTLAIHHIIVENAIVDWWHNAESKRRMQASIDDYLYDTVHEEMGVALSADQIDSIAEEMIELAMNNREFFHL